MVRPTAALRLSLLAAVTATRRPSAILLCSAASKPHPSAWSLWGHRQVNATDAIHKRAMSTNSANNIWGFSVKDISGNDVPLSTYKDKKALLIVNVASQCGFTPQYRDLQALQDEFGPKGFSVLAFPCNQFGGQEPGSAEEVCQFAKDRFKITFPLFDKIDVNGRDAHPLYEYLKNEQAGFITNAIKWNYTKFLVVDGVPTKRYSPHEAPLSFKSDIAAAVSS